MTDTRPTPEDGAPSPDTIALSRWLSFKASREVQTTVPMGLLIEIWQAALALGRSESVVTAPTPGDVEVAVDLDDPLTLRVWDMLTRRRMMSRNLRNDIIRLVRAEVAAALSQVEAERDAAVAGEKDAYEQKAELHRHYAERLKVAEECLKSLQGLTVHREHEERIAAVLAQLAQEPAK